MKISRRGMLKGAGLAGAAAAAPGMALAAGRGAVVVVHDSRLPESARFAAGVPVVLRLDLADPSAWKALRRLAPTGGMAVEGLTGWSDWVALRGLLEDKGLRRTSELRSAAPLSGRANLFRWGMKARARV